MNCKVILCCVAVFTALASSTAEEDTSEYGVTPGVKKTSCQCGRLNKNQARIVGGTEAQKNEFPYMVGIKTQDHPFVFCGGAIISQFHVLTAAHCTDPKKDIPLAVTVGDHNIYDPKDSKSAVEYEVKKVIQHEEYDKKGEVENDIALLVTEQMAFNQLVEPICLPTASINLEGQRLKVTGWGKLSPNGLYSEVLRKVDLNVVSLETCDEYFGGINTANPSQICTLTPEMDSCQGDSGGPTAWRDPETNRYTLVGIISFGDTCGKADAPAVSTDVFYYTDWIQKHMAATRSNAKYCTKI